MLFPLTTGNWSLHPHPDLTSTSSFWKSGFASGVLNHGCSSPSRIPPASHPDVPFDIILPHRTHIWNGFFRFLSLSTTAIEAALIPLFHPSTSTDRPLQFHAFEALSCRGSRYHPSLLKRCHFLPGPTAHRVCPFLTVPIFHLSSPRPTLHAYAWKNIWFTLAGIPSCCSAFVT